jgi:hypothetical protein
MTIIDCPPSAMVAKTASIAIDVCLNNTNLIKT